MNHLTRSVKKLERRIQRLRSAQSWQSMLPDVGELKRRALARLSEEDARLANEYECARNNGTEKSLTQAHQQAWQRFDAVYNQVSAESEWPIKFSLDELRL